MWGGGGGGLQVHGEVLAEPICCAHLLTCSSRDAAYYFWNIRHPCMQSESQTGIPDTVRAMLVRVL